MGEIGFAGKKSVSDNKDWCTPLKIIQALNWFWKNGVELDPCSNKDSVVYAKKEIILPEDGLEHDWSGYSTIYVNPPYGRDMERKTTIANWIEKCHDTLIKNANVEIVALIPVATNTAHWKKYIFGSASGICFLSDTRLKFRIGNNENNKGSPLACCLVYWGDRCDDFCGTFSPLGYCVKTK